LINFVLRDKLSTFSGIINFEFSLPIEYKMRSKFDNQDELDRMRFDPDNYKWGIFYFNPKDPRIILPKRNLYMGFTLNFANPIAYLIIILVIAVGIFFSHFKG